jgi:hypothetical protein
VVGRVIDRLSLIQIGAGHRVELIEAVGLVLLPARRSLRGSDILTLPRRAAERTCRVSALSIEREGTGELLPSPAAIMILIALAFR